MHAIGPLTMGATDPLVLAEFERTVTAADRLTVLPRVVALTGLPAALGAGEGTSGAALAHQGQGSSDVLVRPYRHGDELRRVHWRSTARHDELMVRLEERPWRAGTTVLLDRRDGAHRGRGADSSLEFAISMAASVCAHLIGRGEPVDLVTEDGTAAARAPARPDARRPRRTAPLRPGRPHRPGPAHRPRRRRRARRRHGEPPGAPHGAPPQGRLRRAARHRDVGPGRRPARQRGRGGERVFIADEIQTGFCRTGDWFACEDEGVVPDLITTAKGIAGGLPLAAVTGRAEIMDAVHVGGLGGTYGGNPVACAAALGAIETMEAHDLAAPRPARSATIMLPRLRAMRRALRRHRRHPRPRRDGRRRAGPARHARSPTPAAAGAVAQGLPRRGLGRR